LNVRSLRNKWEELNISLCNQINRIDCLILTEVNVTEFEVGLFNIPGFEQFWCLRRHKKGGGIAVFVNSNHKVKSTKKQFSLENSFESLNLEIEINKKQVIDVLAIYRPPEKSKTDFLEELELYVKNNKYVNSVIVGDMNIDILSEDDMIAQKYLNVLAINGYKEVIDMITREERRGERTSKSCIDHIFVKTNLENFFGSVIKTKTSDHYLTSCSFIDLEETANTPEARYYKNHVFSKIKEDVRNIPAGLYEKGDSVETKYRKLQEKFQEIYSNNSEVLVNKEKRRRKNKPWVTPVIIHESEERDKLFKKMKNSPKNRTYRLEYENKRKFVQKLIKKTKERYFKAQIRENSKNTKKVWNIINEILEVKKISVDEKICTSFGITKSPKEIANEFAITFCEEIENKKHKCLHSLINIPVNTIPNSLYLPEATDLIISNIVKERKDPSKSPGFDGIKMNDLAAMIGNNISLVTEIVNNSLDTAIIPPQLKYSVVRPIFKAGEADICTNYRPVSILPSIDKVIENYLASHMQDFLKKFNVIHNRQYAYQKGKGSETLLADFADLINGKLNEGLHVLCLFLDLSKAFDTLDHQKIINSLEYSGIRGKTLYWISNYLKERKMTVKVQDVLSDLKNIKSGVPQGSILGPLLYIIYINSIFKIPNFAEIFMYADDTVLVVSHKYLDKAIEYLQRDYNKVQEYYHDCGIIENRNKTKLMHIRSPHIKSSLPLKLKTHNFDCLHEGIPKNCVCKLVDVVSDHVYLGIVIDQHFKFHKHTHTLSRKLRFVLFKLYRLAPMLSKKILRSVYIALGESLIRYGIEAWGNTSRCHLDKILKLQRGMVRLFDRGKDKERNVKDIFQRNDILSVQQLYHSTIIKNNLHYSKFLVKEQREILKNTRREKLTQFIVPNSYNSYGNRRRCVQVPKLFNNLPESILNTASPTKKEIKLWLYKYITN